MPGNTSLSPRLRRLGHVLSEEHWRKREDPVEAVEAVVGVLLLEEPTVDLQSLLVQRIERAGDPWSGHVSFPGGRVEESDASAGDALRREVLEEVGIDLARDGDELGPLSVGYPSNRPEIKVQPLVYALKRRPKLLPGPEITKAFWVSLSELPSRLATSEVFAMGERRRVDSYLVEGRVVWGFTYRVLNELIQIERQSNSLGC